MKKIRCRNVDVKFVPSILKIQSLSFAYLFVHEYYYTHITMGYSQMIVRAIFHPYATNAAQSARGRTNPFCLYIYIRHNAILDTVFACKSECA